MILISEIANQINGIVEGNPDLEISGVCDIKKGQEGKITFLGNSKYMKFFNSTNSSAIIVDSKQSFDKSDKTLIRVKNPHLGFAKTLELFQEKNYTRNEIHPTAVIKNLHLNTSSFFVFKIHELYFSSNVAEITSVSS